MKKRVFSFIFSIFLLCFLPYNYVFAVPENISVEVNGVPLELDVAPVIENGRTLVPVRAICEALGCEVEYSDGSQIAYEASNQCFDTSGVVDTFDISELSSDNITITFGGQIIKFNLTLKSMSINGFAEPIDTAPRIINGRTLVPLRALSESLGANVVWEESLKKVSINKNEKSRDHIIKTVSNEFNIYDTDGTWIEVVRYSYPEIENLENNCFIDKINYEYRRYAEEFINENLIDVSQVKLFRDNYGMRPLPVFYELKFIVHTDKNGLLSITNFRYEFGGGMHGNWYRESRTFDLNKKKELTISDILKGDKLDRRTAIYKAFLKRYSPDRDEPWIFSGSCDNAKFYLKDRSLMLYFDIGEVACMAFGFPMAEIPYSEELFKIKLN